MIKGCIVICYDSTSHLVISPSPEYSRHFPFHCFCIIFPVISTFYNSDNCSVGGYLTINNE